ncbi:acyl carrier protein [Nitratireductor pacificus]|uniref:Carrier domain-containing protein n=1 Tax=Nitratireductor pacificus pht-3B TaxID=391937 RepID=K2LKK8_9HYPH|nr:acyl carrier protein [Nitratireductor pacificus]EKF18274.1 hypothetical protein NA2_14022 [Nitratireductor pacificus pht-3B]
MSASVKSEIHAFIVENFLFGDASQLPAEEISLIETDLVDSTGILEMVLFLEERFAISVADAEIVPDNFDTVARLVAFVERKRAAAEA